VGVSVGSTVGVSLGGFRKLVLEYLDNASVDLRPLAPQHRLVCRVLHERVLERIDCVRRLAALVDEL